ARDLNGKTALHYAVEGWSVAHVEMLIALKANLFAFDNNNLTPRLLAQKQSMTDIAEILHRAEPTGYVKSESVAWSLLDDADAVEGFDLHTAAWANDIESVLRLLSEGVSVDARVEGGVTPLMTASGAGNLEIIKQLVERGASLEARDDKGDTAQDWARKNDRIEVLHWLQEAAGIDWRKLEKSTERPFDW
ncbi:MAG: ankyrin repeat domain-containing protein, partial [Chthonomonadaceae bacterium]|nr:ankyrin repeat domain-containing protein [Chthonomonadaceae bacterium]